MSSLLIHSELVPARAREALRAALAGPREQREESLTRAARILHDEGNIDCRDALELVGLHEHLCGTA